MIPFVVMIAGPNGSGKTTLTRYLVSSGIDLGEYINPDDIAANLPGDYAERVAAAQIEAERRREACLVARRSFTFETVMSHPSKLDVFSKAHTVGFRTILYFVAVEDPIINVARVKLRVAQGGHDVPEDRIRARYLRTMAMLADAARIADIAYIFDNTSSSSSTERPRLVLTVRDSCARFEPHTASLPRWVHQNLLSKAS